MPAPTAMHAFMTDPNCPEVSTPLSYQFTSSAQASMTSMAAAPVNPLGTPIAPG